MGVGTKIVNTIKSNTRGLQGVVSGFKESVAANKGMSMKSAWGVAPSTSAAIKDMNNVESYITRKVARDTASGALKDKSFMEKRAMYKNEREAYANSSGNIMGNWLGQGGYKGAAMKGAAYMGAAYLPRLASGSANPFVNSSGESDIIGIPFI